MISIIICSVHKESLEALISNIEQTIGTAFEIIAIDNSQAKKGLCEVYNNAADRAVYEILCFMHEDIFFDTIGWGLKVMQHLSNKDIGLIGLAGGDTKSKVPSSWASLVFESEISIIQHYKHSERAPEHIMKTGYPHDKSVVKNVACLDGVWMCTRKEVFEKHSFDSMTFTGFHGYDIDFSLQILTEYRVCVISDIIVHHFSEGKYNRDWITNMVILSDKWRGLLPVSVRDVSDGELLIQHWTAIRAFLNKLMELEYTKSSILYYYFKYTWNKYFRIKYFLYFLKSIVMNKATEPGV